MGETRGDLLHLLEDLRDAYAGQLEETILTEIVANSLDSGAAQVRLTTERGGARRTWPPRGGSPPGIGRPGAGRPHRASSVSAARRCAYTSRMRSPRSSMRAFSRPRCGATSSRC